MTTYRRTTFFLAALLLTTQQIPSTEAQVSSVDTTTTAEVSSVKTSKAQISSVDPTASATTPAAASSVAASDASAKQQQCLAPKTYSLVTSSHGLAVCPVAPANMTVEGAASRSNCLGWCARVGCVSYTFHDSTTNCEIFLYAPQADKYQPFDGCFNYVVRRTW